MAAEQLVKAILNDCLAQRYMEKPCQELLDIIDTIEDFPETKPDFAAEAERLAQKIQDGIRADRVLRGNELERAVREAYKK